ncbi:TMEM175 family protein [Longimicrobium sp.]|uniref:TMEM175 family protein n=1 Tax=Longimicrobium sp. TaxID=2029185 RepID=UPI002E36B238|nr:TMEM175 family protein [Longimicrobium sp.]HEX6039905.1 TMEM175 family protein [Longimicrobium sp.]
MSEHDPTGYSSHGVSPHRLNALSDAVFAIAMTLMALEITETLPDHLPIRDHTDALLLQLLSYALGFLILGLFWSTHQAQSHYTAHTDRVHTWLKIAFLFFVALIPVAASLLNKAIHEPSSILVYGITLTGAASMNLAQWTYATAGRRLVRNDLETRVVRRIQRRLIIVIAAYFVVMAVSFWNPLVSVGMFMLMHLVAVFIPAAPPETGPDADEVPAGG